MKNILFFFMVILLSCNSDDDNGSMNCTEEIRAGLVVRVKDAVTNLELQEGVVVTATDGSYSEILEYGSTSTSTFVGAFERPGNYILTVSANGYQSFASGLITVTADVCHVIPKNVTIALQPE